VESGLTSYTYYGNIWAATLTGGVTRTYTYNTRNQVTSKTYSATAPATPAVSYCYDGKVALDSGACAATATVPFSAGRLTGVGSSAAAVNYTGYDWLGRIVNSEQRVDGRPYAFTYGYLMGGQLASEGYPSGRTVSYTYNSAGQATAVAGYVNGIAYAPHGAVQSGTFGPLTESYGYNSRLQLTDLTAAKGGAAQWTMHNDYGSSQNNGNLLSQTVDATGAGGARVTGTQIYDALNRLSSRSEAGVGAVSQSYGYDSVGNRWVSGGRCSRRRSLR